MRGALALQLKRYSLARADLEAYLELQPQAADGDTVRQQLQSIARWVAQNN
jgi:regulator of sirC expression with transglutaminase-like and TPR domain